MIKVCVPVFWQKRPLPRHDMHPELKGLGFKLTLGEEGPPEGFQPERNPYRGWGMEEMLTQVESRASEWAAAQ